MAARTIVQLIDDLDGGDADETVSFGLDGVTYDIDLSSGNAGSLRKALSEFIEAGRRIGGRKGRSATTTATTISAGGDKTQNQAIRAWARSQGHQISDRGRIPSELIAQFQQAHGV